MTRSDRSFPVGPRLLALCVALAAILFAVPVAGAAPSASDVQQAHNDYLAAQQSVQQYQQQISVIQQRLDAAVQRVEQEQAELEQIKAEIADTTQRIADAKTRYERIRARLNDRAVQAFISGPSSGLEFVLGATSLSDLSDRLEFVDVIAQSDAGLAQEVSNLEAALQIEESNLERLEADQQAKVTEVAAQRDAIMGDLQRQQQLRDQAEQAVQSYLSKWKNLDSQRNQYLRSLTQQTTSTTSPHTSVDLPPGFVNPLRVCPVAEPRAFGDGFGAPRYTGSFHLHAGVDILSNYGTPIVAPFDGTAKESYNTLGGNSEYVYGAQGYVYNAHLDHYSSNSNGPVQAGEIIGFVGDTGDATGTPHDHFEWHPNSIPSNWPASSYGYAVVGTAVNPYPLLLDICG
jgi:murein DD-endopeptidase MepM/ murein hydrolase activator NlpD